MYEDNNDGCVANVRRYRMWKNILSTIDQCIEDRKIHCDQRYIMYEDKIDGCVVNVRRQQRWQCSQCTKMITLPYMMCIS